MTISDLCIAIDDHTGGSDTHVNRDFILSQLDVRVRSTPGLRCDEEIRFTGRPEPLKGDEAFDERFLLFEYSAHGPDMTLSEMEDLTAIQKAILSGGGVLNLFTDWMIPFVDGQLTPYRLTYDARSVPGPKILGRQEIATEYSNKALVWLPVGDRIQIMENKRTL